jgi:hypothetical protein
MTAARDSVTPSKLILRALQSLCVVLALPTATVTAVPEIACNEPLYDFGTVATTTIVVHAFAISNSGQDRLEINRIVACCGATAKLSRNVIPPGEWASFEVNLNLEGRQSGVRKVLYLGTNDPKQPLFRIGLRGTIGPPVSDGRSGQIKSPNSQGPIDTNAANERLPPAGTTAAIDSAPRSREDAVSIDFFFEPGCVECAAVRRETLPELRRRFEGYYALNEWDINVTSNALRLVAFQDTLHMASNSPVCMVVDRARAFNGLKEIRSGLLDYVEVCVSMRLDPGWQPPVPVAPGFLDTSVARKRVREMTLAIVLVSGLIDGINPCAIGTLVFFMSLLGVARVRGAAFAAVGASFCLASFVGYTAIGFGLFRMIRVWAGFGTVKSVIEVGITALLIALAWLSLRDALRYRKTERSDAVTVQLPESMKRLMRRIMRSILAVTTGEGRAFPSFGKQPSRYVAVASVIVLSTVAFVIGAAVTVLESVCTGQLYVPTLVLVAREYSPGSATAWFYLLLYNLMFVVPLVTIFILISLGLRTDTLLEWSKRNVVVSKTLLALAFTILATLIWIA